MARKNPVAGAEVEVGRRLRLVRERSHLLQTQLALILGIGRERLASYEAGRVPLPFRIGERVCDLWGVNPFWLAEGTKPQIKRHFFSISEESLRQKLSFRALLGLVSSQNNASWVNKEGVTPAKRRALPAATIAILPWESQFHGELEEPEDYFHPGVARVVVDKLEHDPFARRMCIAHYGPVCQVCGLMFNKAYKKIGANLFEIHNQHSGIQTGGNIDLITALIPVCPLCHRLIHSRTPMYSVQEVRKKVGLVPVSAIGRGNLPSLAVM